MRIFRFLLLVLFIIACHDEKESKVSDAGGETPSESSPEEDKKEPERERPSQSRTVQTETSQGEDVHTSPIEDAFNTIGQLRDPFINAYKGKANENDRDEIVKGFGRVMGDALEFAKKFVGKKNHKRDETKKENHEPARD